MKIKPIKKYRKPGFPRRDIFTDHPELLLGHAPQRWLKKGITAGALLAFVGAGSIEVAAVPLQEKPAAVKPANEKANRKLEIKKETVKVAPLFIHGDGTGSTGCVVISPPAFLSEAEALNLIIEALKKENIFFDQFDYVVPGLTTTWEDWRLGWQIGPGGTKNEKVNIPFYFDAYSSKFNFGIKFVSKENYFKLDGENQMGTLYRYNLIETSQVLREKLKARAGAGVAVFYDPLAHEINGTKQELLNQVEDFITWFKREIANQAPNNK